MKKLLGILVLGLLLIPTLAMSGTFKDEDGNPGLKAKSRSGFKTHVNYFGQGNDHNFKYIKDENKARAGKYFQRFELRDGDFWGSENWDDCKNDRKRFEFSAWPTQIVFYDEIRRGNSVKKVDININPKLKPVD